MISFIDQIQCTLDVMHVGGIEAVELATYRLKGVAILWYETWKQSKGIDAPQLLGKNLKRHSLIITCHWRSERPVQISSLTSTRGI